MNQETNLIIGIVTIFGFLLAYFQYLKANTEKRRQILTIVKSQLDSMEEWVGVYENDLTDEQKYDNANPFKLIFEIQNTPLINVSSLEEFSSVPEAIINNISSLNQNISRIKSIQEFRNQIASSDLDLSQEIYNDIEESKNKDINFSSFIGKYNIKKPREKLKKDLIMLRYIKYGIEIHCKIIGNSTEGMRKDWENTKTWVENEIKEIAKIKLIYWTLFSLAIYSSSFLLRDLPLFNNLNFNELSWQVIFILLALIFGFILENVRLGKNWSQF